MKNLEELILLQENELLELLGSDLSKHQALPRPPHQYKAFAQSWLNTNSKYFQDIVCNSEKIQGMVKNDTDFKDLILAVFDLLISLQFGISPLTVSVLLVKNGIGKLCKNYWK